MKGSGLLHKRRVVVTGLGLVTPLGIGAQHVWSKLLNGDSGISKLTDKFPGLFDSAPVKIAGIVPRSEESEPGKFCAKDWLQPGDKSRFADVSQFAMSASLQAANDAGLSDLSSVNIERFGTCIGCGIGSLDDISNNYNNFLKSGYKKVSPMFIPRILANMPAGNVSIRLGLQGPNHSVSSACTTGAHSLGDAMRFIQFGDADIMIAGATEAPLHPLSIAGFNKIKALAQNFNESPTTSSRPFDTLRSGFVMSEGAGAVILEDLDHAKSRNAKIYCEIVGYGLSGDAYHMTMPSVDGRGAKNSMKRALANSDILPEQVDYINAHATSTPAGDAIEMKAIESVFSIQSDNISKAHEPKKIAVSSTKSSIGHLLGAAGAVEAIFAILSVSTNQIPPTFNLENLETSGLKTTESEDNNSIAKRASLSNSFASGDPQLAENRGYKTVIEYVTRESEKRNVNVALSNSFGFGGTNASLVFAKYSQ